MWRHCPAPSLLLTGQRLGRRGVPQSTVLSLAAAWEAAAIAATTARVSSASGRGWQDQGLGVLPERCFAVAKLTRQSDGGSCSAGPQACSHVSSSAAPC